MVWGLTQPKGFGDFFPDGDFEGWDAQIKAYFDTEMSTAERAQHDNWHVASKYEISRKFTRDLGPVADHEQPREFRARPVKALADLFKMSDQLLAVSAPLKNLIEGLEPDTHQFWPIRITHSPTREVPGPFHALVIRRFHDSFSPDQSEEGCWRESNGKYRSQSGKKKDYAGLALSRATFGGSHLWRETRLADPAICFSDTMKAEIDAAGLRIPTHYPLKEV